MSACLLLACGEETQGTDSSDCVGAKCDAAEDDAEGTNPCEGRMLDMSGRGLGRSFAGELGDPLARLVFGAGDTCPTTAVDVVAKLNATGVCRVGDTAVISEVAAITGDANHPSNSYRTASKITCFDGAFDGMLGFVSLSMRLGQPAPQGAELFVQDPERGVFNFYDLGGGEVRFFGDSDQFLLAGPGGPANGDQERKCANCHPSGGLVMKELRAPWQHWESEDGEAPGALELIDQNRDLLSFNVGGEDLELFVEDGNEAWNGRRLQHVLDRLPGGPGLDVEPRLEATVADLVRPVFCPTEAHIDSDFGESTSVDLRNLAFASELTDGFPDSFVSFSSADYETVTRDGMGQRMVLDGFFDTVGTGTTIRPAAIATHYRKLLVEEEIVSRSFLRDVMMVDMTRPLISEERCGLLRFAPDLAADEIEPGAIEAGFLAALKAETDLDPAAAELLRNLEDTSTETAPAAVERFLAACKARQDEDQVEIERADGAFIPVDVIARDAMLLDTVVRLEAIEHFPVLEELAGLALPLASPTVPDDLALDSLAGLRFDPNDCTLTNRFVSVD